MYFSGRVVLALTMALFKMLKIDASHIIILGLNWYSAARVPVVANASKRERRQAAAIALQGGPEKIFKEVLGEKAISEIPFTEDVKQLGTMVAILVINLLVCLSTLLVLRAEDDHLMLDAVALLISFLALYYTAKVELQRSSHTTSHLIFIGAVGMAASVAALTMVPRDVLDFQLEAASVGLARVLSTVTKNAVVVEPMMLAVGVSAWAGASAAFLLAPAARYARLMWQVLNVRPWGQATVGVGRLQLNSMRLIVVLPVVVVLLQVKPMVTFWPALASRPGLLALLQPVLFLTLAGLNLALLRPLCQSFLNSAVLEYHALRHNAVEDVKKNDMIALRMQMVAALVGRVAVQLLSLGAIMLGCGVVVLLQHDLLQPPPPAASGLLSARNGTSVLTSLFAATPAARMPPLTTPPLSDPAATAAAAPSVAGVPPAASADPASPTTPSLDSSLDQAPQAEGAAGTIPGATASPSSSQGGGKSEAGDLEGFEDTSSVEQQSGDADGQSQSAGGGGTSERAVGAPGQAALANAAASLGPFLWFVGTFLGWWTCLVWGSYCIATLAVFRLGLGS